MSPVEFWKVLGGILLMGVIFWYFYFRGRGSSGPREDRKLQQIESELKDGKLVPAEFELRVNQPVQWLIHRYDSDPEDEIFEINELELYELLPAGHTTVMAFLPEKKGKFKIVLGTDREVGVMKIE